MTDDVGELLPALVDSLVGELARIQRHFRMQRCEYVVRKLAGLDKSPTARAAQDLPSGASPLRRSWDAGSMSPPTGHLPQRFTLRNHPAQQ
jgi:hypothetical protein